MTEKTAAPAGDARADWERRIYRRLTDTGEADPATALPAPEGLTADPRHGFVLLRWRPVDGASGYVVERTASDDDPRIVDHGGSDVPAVPGCEFADTGLRDGVTYRYRVGAVTGNEHPAWNWSTAVEASTMATPPEPISATVDAGGNAGRLHRVWHVIGSERLTQLRFGDDGHGHHIGEEFAEALRRAHDDLGVRYVRAHAILHDDNQVVTRNADGTLSFDFTAIDRLYDQILDLGIRPIVELGFMPAALASDPSQTVFTYRGIICPPQDYGEWRRVVAELTDHLVARYGIDEVATWGFEVWNEPNLEVFWTGTQAEYLRLYAEAAQAVKSVDARLRVGGPSTAASEWIEALAGYAESEGLPLDFVTTHTYGNLPLDFRPALGRHGFAGAPIQWTEWGVGSTHFGPIHDGVAGAPFILSGYKSAQGRMDALAYWVVSDHFEELGRPPRLFHDGFGLLTVGNLAKPRYWAVHLAAHMGDRLLPVHVSGDGAGVLVDAWASRHEDGTVDVLLWDGTINAEVKDGDPRLTRRVQLDVTGLSGRYTVELARIDAEHSNILRHAPQDVDWPTRDQFAQLATQDRLDTEPLPELVAAGDQVRLAVDLPQPGVARVRLCPNHQPTASSKETAR